MLIDCMSQYEVVFPDSYIFEQEASSRLSYARSLSATASHRSPIPSSDSLASPNPETSELSPISSFDQQSSSSSDARNLRNPHDRPTETYEHMILNSTPYLCTIPRPPTPSINSTSSQKAAEEEAAELARATDRGWDLLQDMTGTCLYFISGWWSYSFCYAESVKQFHQLPPGKGGAPAFPPVEDPTTPSYVLGRFGDRRVNAHRSGMGGAIGGGSGGAAEKEAGLGMEDRSGETTQVQAKGTSSSRFLSQKLSGGTTCDLTGAPRRVEIQFHCHPQSTDRIGWIREVSTCSYLMMVYTPRLCNDVAFSPPREDKAEQIVCREVVGEDEVAEWEARKKREAEKRLVGETAETANPKLPVIGGIEVGGMKQVGMDGRRLEPPKTPGNHGRAQGGGGSSGAGGSRGRDGNPRTELVAKMDPKQRGGKIQRLSDDQLRKLGLDVQVVEAARRRLEAMAGKKRWRLEAFIVDDGWEMRGIVEDDSTGEDGGHYEGEVQFNEVDERHDEQQQQGAGGVGENDGAGAGSQEEYKDEL